MRYHVCQFSDKTVNLTFLAQISPKMNLGLEIQKSNIGIKISNFEILYVSIFSQIDNFDFLGPNSPPKKKILFSKLRKSKSRFGITSSKISCVSIFSQNRQVWFFSLNLGKLPKCVRYFGSFNVASVGKIWVETEMSGVDVDGAGWGECMAWQYPILYIIFSRIYRYLKI